MKNDRYLKTILTIIAVCLIWICIRDIKLGGNYLFAENGKSSDQEVFVTGGELDVRVLHVNGTALTLCEPISVQIVGQNVDEMKKN